MIVHLLPWFINFLIKKALHLQVNVLLAVVLNPCLKMNNLLKSFTNQLLENLKKRKVHSAFKDNIWGAHLADMQLISKFNKGFRFLLCVIDIFSEYAWVVPLKDKKCVSIIKAFQKNLKQSNRKQNKAWADKGSEFYNKSIKLWLEKNSIEMHSAHNEGKSVVAERFIRTLKSKIYKYTTSVSKNVYILLRVTPQIGMKKFL